MKEVLPLQRENVTSRPEIILNLPETTFVTMAGVTGTEKMIIDMEQEASEDLRTSLEEDDSENSEGESKKVPKEIPSSNEKVKWS